MLSIVLTSLYCILYITNLDIFLQIPTGLVVDYLITLSIITTIIILIKSNIDKLPGAIFFSISMLAFILPIIYWLVVELYSTGVSHDSEPPMLIGSILCFTIFNLHSYFEFKKSYNDDQRSSVT